MVDESEMGLPPGADLDQHWQEFFTGDPQVLPAISRMYRRIPAPPRCKACGAPFSGPFAPLLKVLGVKPWPLNEQLCRPCYKGLGEKQGGAEVPVSLLFTDVRGSTALAEEINPTEYRSLLKRFFKKVLTAVDSQDGVIDHIVGDGVMAMWVPAWAGREHPQKAIAAGRALARGLVSDRILRGSLPAGVGVHTGSAWVGVVGETGKHDFTVIGDVPNTTARLGSAAEGGELAMSAEIVRSAGMDTSGLESRVLHAKGKSRPLHVWVERAPAG